MLTLSKVPLNILSVWWSNQTNEYFERLVENYKNVIIHIMSYNFQKCDNNLPIIVYEPNLEIGLQTLALLFRINHTQRTHRIPYEQFYVPELLEYVDLQQDYLRWIENKVNHLKNFIWTFCTFFPKIQFSIRPGFISVIIHSCLMPKPKHYCFKQIRPSKCKMPCARHQQMAF